MPAPLLLLGAGLGVAGLLALVKGKGTSSSRRSPGEAPATSPGSGREITTPAPSGGGWSTASSSVDVPVELHPWLAELAARVSPVPVVVTSGRRSTSSQAQAMADDLDQHRDLYALYAQADLVLEVVAWYPDVGGMTAALDDQVSRGEFLSEHLSGTALDLRTHGSSPLSADQVAVLKAGVEAGGATALLEVDHLHVEGIPRRRTVA